MGRPRALLTGRNGFTGRYVAYELEAAGFEVIGLSDRQEPADTGSITANLLDRDAVIAAVCRHVRGIVADDLALVAIQTV